MRRIIFFVSIVAGMLLFSGCGGDKPEDVAKDMIEAISDGDIKKIDSLSAGQMKENKLANLNGNCKDIKVKAITDKAKEVLSKVRTALKENKKEAELIFKNLEKEHPSAKSNPKEMLKLSVETVYMKFLPNEKIDEKLMPVVLAMKRGYAGRDAENKALELLGDDANKVDAECIHAYFGFEKVDAINVLEVKKSSDADRKTVRLELELKGKDSIKIELPVELIKKEWKVTSFYH